MEPRWIKLDQVDSTNNWISAYLKKEANHGELVVLADYQESGRGQGDNSWVSRKGENLLMSMLLFPEFLSASDQFQLTRMASLALVDYLRSIGMASMIKWPNDIVTGSRKIAGILIELGVRGGNLTHSIIGIGLNLNQAVFPEFRIPATSVFLKTGKLVPPEGAARGVLTQLSGRYEALRSGEPGALERAYLEKLYGIGRTISVEPRIINRRMDLPDPGPSDTFPPDTEQPPSKGDLSDVSAEYTVTGILRGVNEYGELQLELPGGAIRTFNSGVVRMRIER